MSIVRIGTCYRPSSPRKSDEPVIDSLPEIARAHRDGEISTQVLESLATFATPETDSELARADLVRRGELRMWWSRERDTLNLRRVLPAEEGARVASVLAGPMVPGYPVMRT